MKVLVIPSNRADSLRRFFDEWGTLGGWDDVVIVWDGDTCPVFGVMPPPYKCYTWPTIDDDLGDDKWIISRKDSAIRCYGFLKAWQMGADYVMTLDDDCYPSDDVRASCGTLFEQHIARMNHTLWLQSAGCRTRGFPYYSIGIGHTQSVVNMGLWSGIGDWDSVQTLNNPEKLRSRFLPPAESWIVPSGQMVPFCGMNFCAHRDVIPLLYFPLMGEGQPYRRFDDIWCGVIMKRILDHLRLTMSVGPPHIEHIRASDPMVNLVKEAPGIAANESFWEYIWQVKLTATTPIGCMIEMGYHLIHHPIDKYISKLGMAIDRWAHLFVKV